MFRLACSALAVLAVSAVFAQAPKGVKNPPSEVEDRTKFMLPTVRGTDPSLRLDGFLERRKREAASPFSQIRWRNVGPEVQSGRVVDIESPLDQPGTLIVAFATGGLWRTTDEGNTWTPLFDDQPSFGIGNFAVSRDGKTLWVGTGESNSQRTSYAGTGVYRSDDAGKTWRHLGLEGTHHIGRIQLHPTNPNVAYVAAIGPLYSQSAQRGVFRTSDGGKSWRKVLFLNEETGAIDLVLDPKNPKVLYAATWDRDRRAWNMRDGGPGTGIYKTTDGGERWTKLSGGLPTGPNLGRVGLAICKDKPNVLYACIDDQSGDPDWPWEDERVATGVLTPRRFLLLDEDTFLAIERPILNRFFASYLPSDVKPDDMLAAIKDKKKTLADVRLAMERRNPEVFVAERVYNVLYRSDDAGRTWRKTTPFRLGDENGYYYGKVSVNPRDPEDVVVMGLICVRSRDGGKTWRQIARNAHVDFHAFWYDRTNPNRMWLGNDGGPYVSGDDGQTWRNVNNLGVGQFTTIAVDMKIPYNIYGGLQDNGTMRGPSTYAPGRSDPSLWRAIGGGDGSALAVDPRDGGDVVYVASQFGAHQGFNQRTNERWSARANPPRGDAPARYNWISPLIISPHHPDIVYLGAQRLYRSLNMGRNYEPISPDLTRNRPNGDVPHSTLKDISESPFKFGRILVGTDDGKVWITHDHGNSWNAIDTPVNKWVCRVIASKWKPNVLYVAQTGYREDDFRPYLWRSDDLGKTWTSIVGDLPAGEPINVVREDPNREDVLYLGTDFGVWISFNGGKNWEALKGGLPVTPVHDLVIHPRENEMVIASHARSVWVLPLKVVHSITPELRVKAIDMTALDAVTRMPNWGIPRRPKWEFSTGDPIVVRGQAWLRAGGPGKLRLLDKDGKLLKEQDFEAAPGFNFYELSLELGAGKPGTQPVGPRKVTGAAEAVADPFGAERATYPPVGEYFVEIQVGAVSGRTPLRLRAP